MNTLMIINLARRYAKNIIARKYPDLPAPEAKARAKRLAETGSLRALARINLSRQAKKGPLSA